MIVKVCGMRDSQNIRDVTAAGADWIGMIFWPQSPRCVGRVPDTANDNGVKRVGVFVDGMVQDIIVATVNYRLDIVQLHGTETPAMIRNLRATLVPDIAPHTRIIKAISVSSPDDISLCHDYEDCVDTFLFDTKCRIVGGSGKQFDWSVLSLYHGSKPFLLSGGIGPSDTRMVKEFSHPQMIGVDINSRFETAPGMKDAEQIKNFIKQIKNDKI